MEMNKNTIAFEKHLRVECRKPFCFEPGDSFTVCPGMNEAVIMAYESMKEYGIENINRDLFYYITDYFPVVISGDKYGIVGYRKELQDGGRTGVFFIFKWLEEYNDVLYK